MSKVRAIDTRGKAAAPLDTPTDFSTEAVREISEHLNAILATTFALYLKTKNFHWHVSGPHFRDYHLLLDEQGEQIFASTDDLAERVRKIGGTTIRSIGQISELSWSPTTRKSLGPCANATKSATSMATSLPPAFWKILSMKPSGACGSCLKQAARPTSRGTDVSG